MWRGFGAVTISPVDHDQVPLHRDARRARDAGVQWHQRQRSSKLLQGVDIEGAGTGNNGVNITNATKVTIQSCSIRNFPLARPVGARVVIMDSLVTQASRLGNRRGGQYRNPA